MTLSHFLALLVDRCRQHAGAVVLAGLVLATVAGAVASFRLGVSTDTDALFAADLPWRQRAIAHDRDFPQFTDMLVAVIDAASANVVAPPEALDATAVSLAAALAADTRNFSRVTLPGASPFFDLNGLLFLEVKELREVLDRSIDAQPFLGQLAADPSARGLFAALSLLAMGAERGANLAPFADVLTGLHIALADAVDGRARPLSWQTLLGGAVTEKIGKQRFVQAKIHLDLSALKPGAAASAALRQAAADLEFVANGTVRVRLTGAPALADEEFSTVTEGAVTGALASATLVLLWLVLAVRSWRLVLPIIASTALGLLLTTAFAAVAIGTLNLISVAFAVLFLGLAVDFAIQFCVRAREIRADHSLTNFLPATAAIAGPPILIAAAAAAAGFFAFAPTAFRGVAELGTIAGAGMIIAFACTFTFLPAALTLCCPKPGSAEIGIAAGAWLESRLNVHRRKVLAAFALAGLFGALLLPRLDFDSDPLHTKDPTTEAMRTLSDLLDQPLTNPYSADILAASRAAADTLAARLGALKGIGEVITLSSFVPADQPEKLELIGDAAGLLAATLAPRAPAAPVTAGDLRLAVAATLAQITAATAKLAKDDPLHAIAADLMHLESADDATLLAADAALTRFLPAQLGRLRSGLAASPIDVASLPTDLVRDWALPDGRVRVQAMAPPGADLARFVAEVRTVAPDAGGSAVTIVETAATVVGAFRAAAIGALLAIATLLAMVLRRVIDIALVLLALLLSALITVLLIVGLGMRLNFANIIALPLLQGVGVSFNIYFVMNWRAGQSRYLGTATARAILFSALTTATAFGSLALSHHPGTASMGVLLLLSLAATLGVTLLFLPVLLHALMRES